MMKFLLLLPLLVSSVSADGQLPNYRIQSTTYAVTITTTMESKNTNCQNTFGEGSVMADFDDLKRDYASALEEYNEALTGVFFKSPTASFFVSYKGLDSPPNTPDSKTTHYVLRNAATSSTKNVLEKLGNSNLETSKKQHQVLCAVPVSGDENAGVSTSSSSSEVKTPKPYKSPDDNTRSSDNSNKTSWMTKIVVVTTLVGIALMIRKYRVESYNFPARSNSVGGGSNSRAYYSVLDPQKDYSGNGGADDGGAFLAPGDMSASLCAGSGANETELSGYSNPNLQHDLHLSQSLPQQQSPV